METYTFANGNSPKSTDYVTVPAKIKYIGPFRASVTPKGINAAAEINKVVITADYQNRVKEYNEANNILSKDFTPALPDFTLANFSVVTLRQIKFDLTNAGKGPDKASQIKVDVFNKNNVLVGSEYKTIAPKFVGSQTVSVPLNKILSIAYVSKIVATADYKNAVPEMNEANNVLIKEFPMPPDFVPVSAALEKSAQKNMVDVNIGIANTGSFTSKGFRLAWKFLDSKGKETSNNKYDGSIGVNYEHPESPKMKPGEILTYTFRKYNHDQSYLDASSIKVILDDDDLAGTPYIGHAF